jgi:glycine/D-amino acid oxidase-like deaminating enzyme
VKEYPYWWDTTPGFATDQGPGTDHGLGTDQGPSTRYQGPSFKTSPYDVVIVGAGYTGLSAARRLAQAGASVLVLERESLGWGASSRNGGQVLTGLKIEPAGLVARYGEAHARQLFAVANRAVGFLEALIDHESIDCEYTRTGHIQAAWKPSHFEGFRKEQALLARVFNHRVELLSRPQQHAEIGSDTYHGVLIDERSAALNPARYVIGLASAATRSGASVAAGVAVNRLREEGRAWRVSTTSGEVTARDVLLATDGYTNGVAPDLRRRFVPIGSYIIATEPLPPDRAAQLLPRGRVAFDSKHFLYYFRLTPDRRLLFGGRAEFSTPSEASTRRAASALRAGISKVFPDLHDTRIEYAWSGNVAFTRDQMPRAGKLGGAYYAGGYCGHGVAMATYLGDEIGRRMAGELVENPFFDDAFQPIPLHSGSAWWLPAIGAYYRVKDWIA